MKAFQIKNNIINLNFVQKISHEQPHLNDNNHLIYNVEFIYYSGKTENYEMTQEKFRDLTDIRKKQLNTFQVNNNFINLSTVQRISHGKAYDNDDEIQCFNVEFVYHDGTAENHEMTYEEFQQLVDKCDVKIAFVVDDYINTAYSDGEMTAVEPDCNLPK